MEMFPGGSSEKSEAKKWNIMMKLELCELIGGENLFSLKNLHLVEMREKARRSQADYAWFLCR